MEKKTIGSFIAVLRKANGMTQKELAEKLNVSDKTVSRWERDESAPDLTLIPVIAEIFNVTSDELLRGEKLSDEYIFEKNKESKKEKQLQRIAESIKTKFFVKSIISVGISIIGIIAAMISNFGFTRGTIGFFICCAFITASIICETVFTILAFSSVNTQDYEEETVNCCKRKIFETSCRAFYIIAVLFSSTLPLILATSGDGYLAIVLEEWLVFGLVFAAATTLICYILNIFIKKAAIKKNVFRVNDDEFKKISAVGKLTLRSLAVLLVAVWITYSGQFAIHEILTPLFFAEGNVFESYNDFVAFMETDMPDTSYAEMTVNQTVTMYVPNYEDGSENEEITYYDDHGNEISEAEALTEYLHDDDGHVLCKYINRNQSVYTIKYNDEAENKLPITVYTFEQFYDGRNTVETYDTLFLMAYIFEISLTVIIYIVKRRKIK